MNVLDDSLATSGDGQYGLDRHEAQKHATYLGSRAGGVKKDRFFGIGQFLFACRATSLSFLIGRNMAVLIFPTGKALIDDADLNLVKNYCWRIHDEDSGLQYVARASPWLYMHRLIMSAPNGVLVDHRNGNGLDNRRENLRLATSSQNSANRRKRQQALSSRFKGVRFSRKAKKWEASIGVDRRRIYLGCFVNEEDAARAYNARAQIEFGEFARLNVV